MKITFIDFEGQYNGNVNKRDLREFVRVRIDDIHDHTSNINNVECYAFICPIAKGRYNRTSVEIFEELMEATILKMAREQIWLLEQKVASGLMSNAEALAQYNLDNVITGRTK